MMIMVVVVVCKWRMPPRKVCQKVRKQCRYILTCKTTTHKNNYYFLLHILSK